MTLYVPLATTAHRITLAITTLALALAAVLTGALTAAPAGATTAEDSLTARLNGARSDQGLPSLATRSDLVAVARAQATRMADSGTLYHNPNLTTDVTNWRWVGENVGYGPDVQTVHVAFMNSDAHRANILDTDYTEVGIGVVERGDRVWVAEVFRRPQTVTTSSSSSGSTTTPGWQPHPRDLPPHAALRQHRRLGPPGPGPPAPAPDRLLRHLHQGRREPLPEGPGLGRSRQRRPLTWSRLF